MHGTVAAKVPSMNTATASNLSVAETILSQLGGIGRLRAMIGGKDFLADSDGVTFKWSAKAASSLYACTITLDPSDTYTLRFYTRRMKATPVADVQAADLVRVFQNMTGLYLSL